MATSQNLFQFIQKFYQTIGIYSCVEKSLKKCAINPRNMIILILLTLYTLTMVAFLLFDAETMFDYGFGFYAIIAIINFILNYLLFIWKFEKTVIFIENCTEFIEKSKQ